MSHGTFIVRFTHVKLYGHIGWKVFELVQCIDAMGNEHTFLHKQIRFRPLRMKLISLRSADTDTLQQLQQPADERKSSVRVFRDCIVTGRNVHYPNCLLQVQTALINPYDERVMSLQRDSFYDNDEWSEYIPVSPATIETRPCFFFVYNVDNYYHFIYDTLPYLAFYFHLKQLYPDLQLVINTSHPSKATLPPFVYDILSHLGVIDSIHFVKSNQQYHYLFVASSLTHGGKSNAAPSSIAYDVWKRFHAQRQSQTHPPKRFYVSRRSWVHGQTANMGTNYTTRRKCENEDEVVALLAKYGIQEVFTELLSMEEKIAYFQAAELVVGVIGGGMCNLLFSPSTTKSVCIATPYFLDINARFAHSMDHTKIVYSHCASHVPYAGKFPLYSRVKVVNSESPYSGYVGEVEAVNSATKQIQLNISSNDVAGFSQDFQLRSIWVEESSVEPLDLGLNSPYVCDLQQLEVNIKRALDLD